MVVQGNTGNMTNILVFYLGVSGNMQQKRDAVKLGCDCPHCLSRMGYEPIPSLSFIGSDVHLLHHPDIFKRAISKNVVS